MYQTHDRDEVQLTPEGRYLTVDLRELHERDVVEVCDVCEEPGTADDPLGQFGEPGEPLVVAIAHHMCGLDDGLSPG